MAYLHNNILKQYTWHKTAWYVFVWWCSHCIPAQDFTLRGKNNQQLKFCSSSSCSSIEHGRFFDDCKKNFFLGLLVYQLVLFLILVYIWFDCYNFWFLILILVVLYLKTEKKAEKFFIKNQFFGKIFLMSHYLNHPPINIIWR